MKKVTGYPPPPWGGQNPQTACASIIIFEAVFRAFVMIVVQDIFKQYKMPNGKPLQVLKGFSWTAPSASITGLVGSNGCGKTTMLQILMGTLSADAGQVLVNGKELSVQQLRHECSWVPEFPLLNRVLSGRDCLLEYAFLCGWGWKEAHQQLEKVQQQLPINDFWHRPSAGYSRGQAVLISLGRFLVSNRPIWLLDEPTAGLDFEKVGVVRKWLAQQAREEGKCIVLSTHLINDLRDLADQIVLLKDGRNALPDDPFLKQWNMSEDPNV